MAKNNFEIQHNYLDNYAMKTSTTFTNKLFHSAAIKLASVLFWIIILIKNYAKTKPAILITHNENALLLADNILKL